MVPPLTRRAPPGALQRGSEFVLQRRHVRRLQVLVTLHDVEGDALTFGQRLVALPGDRREVDEHVRLAVALFDEAVTLLVREPLDRAFSHVRVLLPSTTDALPASAERRNSINASTPGTRAHRGESA